MCQNTGSNSGIRVEVNQGNIFGGPSPLSGPLQAGTAPVPFGNKISCRAIETSKISFYCDARAETRLESFLQVLCSVAIPL
jgi:hypothetical protein